MQNEGCSNINTSPLPSFTYQAEFCFHHGLRHLQATPLFSFGKLGSAPVAYEHGFHPFIHSWCNNNGLSWSSLAIASFLTKSHDLCRHSNRSYLWCMELFYSFRTLFGPFDISCAMYESFEKSCCFQMMVSCLFSFSGSSSPSLLFQVVCSHPFSSSMMHGPCDIFLLASAYISVWYMVNVSNCCHVETFCFAYTNLLLLMLHEWKTVQSIAHHVRCLLLVLFVASVPPQFRSFLLSCLVWVSSFASTL